MSQVGGDVVGWRGGQLARCDVESRSRGKLEDEELLNSPPGRSPGMYHFNFEYTSRFGEQRTLEI